MSCLAIVINRSVSPGSGWEIPVKLLSEFLFVFSCSPAVLCSSFRQTSITAFCFGLLWTNWHSFFSMRPPGIRLMHKHNHNYVSQLLKYGFVVFKLRCCSLPLFPIDVHRPVVHLMLNTRSLILKWCSQTSGLLSLSQRLGRTLVHQFCAPSATF